MSGIAPKWAVRRFQPAPYLTDFDGETAPLTPCAYEQTFDDWVDVVKAASTIVGANELKSGVQPSDPVVIKHGDDVVLIYMKLELT